VRIASAYSVVLNRIGGSCIYSAHSSRIGFRWATPSRRRRCRVPLVHFVFPFECPADVLAVTSSSFSSSTKQVTIGLDRHASNPKFAMITTKPRATKGLVRQTRDTLLQFDLDKLTDSSATQAFPGPSLYLVLVCRSEIERFYF